jgi:hypothetical protein
VGHTMAQLRVLRNAGSVLRAATFFVTSSPVGRRVLVARCVNSR